MHPILNRRFISLRTVVVVLTLAFCAISHGHAQMDSAGGAPGGPFGQGRQGFPNLPSVRGTVSSVQSNTATIQTEEGVAYTVQCSDNTRIFKNHQPIKISDIHIGDMLIAAGELDDKAHTLHAVFVGDIDAATVQKMRADLGKTWIAGKVTKIDMDALQLTLQRIDQKTQVIAVNETTSFRKDGQSVTLRDLHVGDGVRGKGSVQNGIFVPEVLHILDAARLARRPMPPSSQPIQPQP